jgi:hypothetical protein
MQIFKAWQTTFEPLHVTTAAAKCFRDLNIQNLWKKEMLLVVTSSCTKIDDFRKQKNKL